MRRPLLLVVLALALLAANRYQSIRVTVSEAIHANADSRAQCTGNDTMSRFCVVLNVVYRDGTFFLAPASQEPPEVLCSVATDPAYIRKCNFLVANVSEWDRLTSAARNCRLDEGIALHRLNPHNLYHALFEDIIPVYGMMLGRSSLSSDPTRALQQLAQHTWGVLLTDGHGPLLDARAWAAFLPEVRLVHPSDGACRADKLLVGMGAACAHWGHCPNGMRFQPPSAAVDFRAMVMERLRIPQTPLSGTHSTNRSHLPHVLVVQRHSTRRIRNLGDVVGMVTNVTGQAPVMIADFAALEMAEQVRISSRADIFILVHGGALASLLWLRPGALIIDIYPYTFPVAHHSSIVHWMSASLRPLRYGHHPFELMNSTQQELTDGRQLPLDCRCESGHCEADTFVTTSWLTVDASFESHVASGLAMWRTQQYAAPCPNYTCWAASIGATMAPSKLPNASYPSCWSG
jgi:hypothetical protein